MVGIETGHVGINVTDLARSRGFYETALGLETLGGSEEGGRSYAFLGAGGRLLLTLWQQSDGRFDARRPGLHHLAFQVPTVEDVHRVESRARALGARFVYDGAVPHGEGVPSGGIYFEDPDGVRLEIYTANIGETHAQPTDGPACGFF